MHSICNRNLVYTIVAFKCSYIHSMVHKCVRMTEGCGIDHKYTEFLQCKILLAFYIKCYESFTHEKDPKYPLNRKLGGPRSRSGRFKGEKISLKLCCIVTSSLLNRVVCSSLSAFEVGDLVKSHVSTAILK